jgi:hypothetical protein
MFNSKAKYFLLILLIIFIHFLGLGREKIISDTIIIVNNTDSRSLNSEENIEFSKNDSNQISSSEKEGGEINLYIIIPFIAAILGILWKFSEIIRFIKKTISINEKRYLKELIKRYESYEKYIDLDVSVLSNEYDLSKNNVEKRAISLNNLITDQRSVQIIGPPGSGKTSILYKLLLSHSKSKLSDKKKRIPVFLEFRGRDVFERIREFLHINQFTKDITVINEKWLRKKLIDGKFLFLIDDVHKLIDTKSLEEQTKMRELLDYNKNQFVLMSRDFIKVSRFGLELFQIAQLNENQIINILKLYSDEQEAHLIYQNFRWDKKLNELYSTPQMLMFLSTIFKKYNSIPSNKSQIFTEFLEIKKMKEFNQDVEAIKKFEKHIKILSHLALQMFGIEDNSYWIRFDDCLTMVNEENNKLIKQGYQNISAEIIIDDLLKQGFLIRSENKIRFVHDQWQEYFAAKKIFEKRLSLKEFGVKQSRDEILFFLSGFHTYLGNGEEKKYCNLFLIELLKENFFLFNKCLKNYDLRWFIKDWQEFYKDIIFTQEQIQLKYKEFFDLYNEIIDIHFKNLKVRFAPFTNSNIGLLVEYDNRNNSCWYGFRQKKDKIESDVIFINKFDTINKYELNNEQALYGHYYKTYNLRGWQSKSPDPNIYKLPVIGAFEEINKQLENLINEQKLSDTEEMKWEKVYYEAQALKNKLRIPRKQNSMSVKDIDNGLKKMKIEKYLFSQRLVKNGIVPNLEKEINELFEKDFLPANETYSTTYSGIYNRRINDKEFEKLFSDLVVSKNLNQTDSIIPPIENLPYNLDPWRKQKLNEQEVDMLLNWAQDFQKRVLKNYLLMIETNFPTSKNLFKTYKSKPICIVLAVDPNKITKSEYLGNRYFYANVSAQQNDVEVVLASSKTEYEKIHSKLIHHLSWTNPYWGFGFSFPRKEPLRESVYDIIEREFKELIR